MVKLEELNMEHYTILEVLFFACVALGVYFAIGPAIDKHIENQDRMLCHSAKISGNVQWLHKCECYYQKGDIKCLQEN